jgi:FkbM family methyltransferase
MATTRADKIPTLSNRAKMYFYANYAVSKFVLLLFEVRTPRIRMYLYELSYVASKLLPTMKIDPYKIGITHVHTTAGKFTVRPNTIDAACVSPAFERQDMKKLQREVGRLLAADKRVLFIDIGADIGTYTISLLNRHRHPHLTAIAFEPSSKSYQILLENVRLNDLEPRVTIINSALGDEPGDIELFYNESAPGSSSMNSANAPGSTAELVSIDTLDAVMKRYDLNHDVIVIKADIEGYEQIALAGGKQTLHGTPVILLVEDCVDPSIATWLQAASFRFETKLTPYNSWWTIGELPGQ